MIHRKFTILAGALIALSAAPTAHSEESLLWKATNLTSPLTVPPYNGEESPFPKVQVTAAAVSESMLLDEQRRMRDEAYSNAEKLVSSGTSLMPDLRYIRVEGFVEGTLGSRVLIGNQWVATGKSISVPLYRSPAALAAIRTLAELDASAAAELTQRINAQLAAQPSLKLDLQKIEPGNLKFQSVRGPYTIPFRIN